MGAVVLASILFVVYSGGSDSSGPPAGTAASLDDPQDELSEDGQVVPVRDRGARNGDGDRSRLAGGTDERTANATADERNPQAKKNTKSKRRKRGRKTSEREKEEEEQSRNEQRWPKPSLTPPGKP